MTTITREQQKQILIDTANHVISRDNTSPYSENLRELARIALASLEAEKGADPVVFTDERNLHHIARGRETSLIWGKQNQEVGDIPLYRHAQPVPVVPEDISGIIERFQYQADHLSEWHHIDEHSCKVNRRDLVTALEFMNSCRAAMLQAVSYTHLRKGPDMPTVQAGNSPATTDGWISCSERMPDREYVLAGDFSGTHYLASIPNVQVGIYADWFDDEKPCWDDGDGNDLHLKEVTHWMPLPAPQQEVK
ncbi:DUF551 domain-containing protein [Salmonella sp. SAL04286]|uniref:DUF551 domain-containing protein n=1 Tax=Salmonella sp. SAL04286 TaxID=3159864 RepID=UPI00397D27D3